MAVLPRPNWQPGRLPRRRHQCLFNRQQAYNSKRARLHMGQQVYNSKRACLHMGQQAYNSKRVRPHMGPQAYNSKILLLSRRGRPRRPLQTFLRSLPSRHLASSR